MDRPRAYEPRRARESPLYRLVINELETYLKGLKGSPQSPEPCAEDCLRAFLSCGVHRFGVARFHCRKCKTDLFVPFSCKRRLVCPSCDGKRSTVESLRAAEELLPEAPYRQWVLTLPKRLRWFVHRDKRLSGELSRLLAENLTRFHRKRCGAGAPAQFHVIQRFGSKVNLHIHVHAVVSDGAFSEQGGILRFHPSPEIAPKELEALGQLIRRKVLLRMRRMKAVPEHVLAELLARPHGGFSLDASVRIAAHDRAGLERLLRYVLRPALSVKRLSYRPDLNSVRYYPKKGIPAPGEYAAPEVLEWTPLEFLSRFARLIPPARLPLIRYHGALAPRSPLRRGVCRAAREGITLEELRAGIAVSGPAALVQSARRSARKVVSQAAKSFAACLRRVFEVDPILCPACGGQMAAVSSIICDEELTRLLAHVGLPADFPKTKPNRGPPGPIVDEDTQVDPRQDDRDGKDQARED